MNLSHDLNFKMTITKDDQVIASYSDAPFPSSSISIDLVDQGNNLVDHYDVPMRSFVLNGIKYIYSLCSSLSVGLRNTSSGAYTLSSPYNLYAVNADGAAADTSHGIFVGSGADAVSSEDYNLASQITHGTSSGYLDHGRSDTIVATNTGSTSYTILSRVFTNRGDTPLTVQEVGLVGKVSSNYILLARDILDNNGDPINVEVDPDYSLIVQYNIQTQSVDNGATINFTKCLAKALTELPTSDYNIYYPSLNITLVNGSALTPYQTSQPLKYGNYNTSDSYGIVVGSSDSAWNSSDTALGSLVSHGVGSGQLFYSAMEFEAVASSGSLNYFNSKRAITNNSGGAVTIKEVGIYCYASTSAIMVARWVLDTPVTLQNSEGVRVLIQIQSEV